jgi:hypothetical protein
MNCLCIDGYLASGESHARLAHVRLVHARIANSISILKTA